MSQTHNLMQIERPYSTGPVEKPPKSWNMVPGTIEAGFPSFLGFGVGQSSSNFLASSVT